MAGPADQEKFEKLAYFSARKIDREIDHVDHAIHRNITTKTPRYSPIFPKTTLKKHQQRRGFPPIATRHYFF
jgi:hypothetical protein